MKYREDLRSGNQLSALGMGCMRFPRNGGRILGVKGAIDYKKAESLVLRAVEKGVNYFDTAYIYSGSEDILGRIFENNPVREKLFLATKMPVMFCKQNSDFDNFFNKQLARLKTNYIDYYLMHNIPAFDVWQNMKNLGAVEWALNMKKTGRIKQFGFSFHGKRDEFLKIIDDYDWDFCQLQYNYSDENFQAGITGLKRAYEKNIPVIVMEPLLGGKLAGKLPEAAARIFNSDGEDKAVSNAERALRWLWNQREVTVVLSGMSAERELDENTAICEKSSIGMLTQSDLDIYGNVRKELIASYKAPCTGCNYCMPCPRGINIPSCFAAFNTSYAFGRMQGWQQYATSISFLSKQPSNAGRCVHCKKCETHCPQGLPISELMSQVKKRMEPFPIRAALWLVRKALGK